MNSPIFFEKAWGKMRPWAVNQCLPIIALFFFLFFPTGCKGEAAGTVNLRAVAGDDLDTWHVRNPLAQGDSLSGVSYGNGTFIAVGNGGTILQSDSLEH